jgi:eukaryotic-like serine/threonine-protein kinase
VSRDRTPRPEGEPESEADKLAEEFLDRLQAGEEPDRKEILKAHGRDGEDLERRLKVVELLHRVGQKGVSSGSSLGRRPLHCPHCTSPVPIAEPGSGEVTCSACGNIFRVSPGVAPAAPGGQLPERIGRFEVLGLLGRGAFGAVYRAHDPELHRTVAIKVPRASFFGTKEEEERFLREARSAAGLLHPGIVKVHEIGEENGVPYLVTECIEGRTLSEVIARRETSFEESARLVAQVAEMLHSAHSQKVIHRDVKPGNILIDRAGAPHLSDFGLARHVEEAVSVTLDGQVLGTPAYMSPEQAAGDQSRVGPRSDTYSLGVVLYELLTGERPFRGSRSMLVHQVLHEEPRPPRSLNQHIPRDLETVCLKAMAKDRRRRYPSALHLADDLGRFLRHEPVRARPVGKPERLWRWAKRNRAVAGLATAVGVLLLLVAVVSAAMAWRTAQARDETRAQLARLNAVSGMRLADAGNLFAALPHLAEALRLDGRDPARAEGHLFRLQAVIERCPRLAWVHFHPLWVRQVGFSPDGKLLACLCGGRLEVLEAASGKPLLATGPADGDLQHFAFSPDGSLLAVASVGNAWLLRPHTGERAGKPLRHDGKLTQVAWSPDGRLLATGGYDRAARIWDAASGEAKGPPLQHGGMVNTVSFSPDGRLLLCASAEGSARIWELAAGAPVGEPLRHRARVSMASWSPDGLRVATASDDRTAAVWDVASGKAIALLVGHRTQVVAASFSPDGRRVVTAGMDSLVRIWDAETGKELLAPIRHGLGVPFAGFGADGRSVLSVSFDGTARLTDPRSGEALMPPLLSGSGPFAGLTHGALSPDGRWVATAGYDGSTRVWDRAGAEPCVAAWKHPRGVSDARFSDQGDRVVTAGVDGVARIWDVRTGRAAAPALPHVLGLRQAVFSPDGGRLATTSNDGVVRIWDLPEGNFTTLTVPRPAYLVWVAFSPDGLRLATASTDNTARVWDARSVQPQTPPLAHRGGIYRLVFSPDGRTLLTAASDGAARLWDAASGALLHELRHKYAVVFADFSPDGRRVATGSTDTTGRLWDAATGAPVGETIQHSADVSAIRFSPDGLLLVTAGLDGIARIWSAVDGRPVSPRLPHPGAVSDAWFCPDGRRVATASEDGTGRLWDIATGEETMPPVHHRNMVFSISPSPDGRRLLTVSLDGTARLVSLPEPRLRAGEAVLLAHLLSGRRIDDTGSVVNLDKSEFQAVCKDLTARHPECFLTSQDRLVAWHRRNADELQEAGMPAEALLHIDALLEVEPGNWELHAARGETCVRAGRMEEAAAAFARSLDLGALDPDTWQQAALAALAAGKLEDYRSISRRLLERFGATRDLSRFNLIAWTCALGPLAIDDLAGLAGRLERMMGSGPKEHEALNTVGALLYRAGEPRRAVQVLEEARAIEPRGGTMDDWLFLAMAYHGLGRREDATRALEKGKALARARLDPPPVDPFTGHSYFPWFNRVSLELLVKEAEDLLK